MNLWKQQSHQWVVIYLVAALVSVGCANNPPTAPTMAPTQSQEVATPAADQSVAAPSTTKLNLNTVTDTALLNTIPGFGNRMVREFFEYRPYISIQQFRKEIGKYVDEAQVAEYEKYVYVPIQVDESDAETLKQIPGVDDTDAEALIAARPYGDNAKFLEKLTTLVSADELAGAAGYLEAE